VPIDGHVSGNGTHKHREFPNGSNGKLTEAEFTDFLYRFLIHSSEHISPGALVYVCMDWRHQWELLSASRAAKLNLLNLCVWTKPNAGMGSLYRSRHELVHVFKNGSAKHVNNVELGAHGRWRSNVFEYPGANAFPRKGQDRGLEFHPTAKPIQLVADIFLDCTKRGDAVLDPFLGAGTSLLAAARTGRRCFGIELDPLYVDTAIDRWQRKTGKLARNQHGQTFAEAAAARGVVR
jgi:DNA modification methylase